jgi:hypothetical protein
MPLGGIKATRAFALRKTTFAGSFRESNENGKSALLSESGCKGTTFISTMQILVPNIALNLLFFAFFIIFTLQICIIHFFFVSLYAVLCAGVLHVARRIDY